MVNKITSLQLIYITKQAKNDLSSYIDCKSQIRKHIYLNSSDTDIFKGIRSFESKDNNVDLTEEDLGFIEGEKRLEQHIYRERNPKVLRMAKEKLKQEKWTLFL